jgi:hypothetical protein
MTFPVRQRIAEPAVLAVAVVALGLAAGGAALSGLVPAVVSWLALGACAGYALSGST